MIPASKLTDIVDSNIVMATVNEFLISFLIIHS